MFFINPAGLSCLTAPYRLSFCRQHSIDAVRASLHRWRCIARDRVFQKNRIMAINTHVILVSGQPTPNITPVLDPDIKPRRIVMLVSPDMAQRADWLKSVLQPAGVSVSQLAIDDAFDIEAIREQLFNFVTEYGAENLALNVTGGTKPMAIAAYEVFRAADRPIFYVHPEQDRLIWMHPAGQPPRELANRIKLKGFLQAHGAQLSERPANFGMPEHLRTLAEGLVRHIDKYQNALRILNWAAMSAEQNESLVSDQLRPGQIEREDFKALLGWFESADVVTARQGRLHFADEPARFFANGGWLEQHVYSLIQSLKSEIKGIQDIGRGLKVERQNGTERIRNELDVAFLAENRLYTVECKTRQFKDEIETGGAGADAIYRLDALSNLLGGLQAKAMLVSYQSLSTAIQDRARAYGILTCAGSELKTLKETLRRWIG
jgi:hypothetical protein